MAIGGGAFIMRVAVVVLAGALLLAWQVRADAPALGALSSAAAASAGSAGSAAAPESSPSQVQQPAQNCARQDGDLSSPGTNVPWAQQVLGFREAWQFSTGQGENVAVIDSGVSGNQQLSGRVTLEQSLTGTSAGLDCVNHGNGVAGIIAAAPKQRDPFVGVAPGARMLGYTMGTPCTGSVHAHAANIVNLIPPGPALDPNKATPAGGRWVASASGDLPAPRCSLAQGRGCRCGHGGRGVAVRAGHGIGSRRACGRRAVPPAACQRAASTSAIFAAAASGSSVSCSRSPQDQR
jgi:hypothetical protein